MHRFLLYNGQIKQTSEPLISPGQTGFMNGWGVFSTIRIFDGILFEFGRHYSRMRHDAELMHVPFPFSAAELQAQLQSLIAANQAVNATLRVAVVRNHGGSFEGTGILRPADLVAFTADLADWGTAVRLYYVPQGRHGGSPFSGTKVTSWAQNLTWYEEAHQRGYDEVILLNERGQVSECTSANIFLIRQNNIWTPPLNTSGCLPGITRALLLEEIRLAGIAISEHEFTPADVETADGVFITSTTRNLLPVREVEGIGLKQSGPVLEKLQHAFREYQMQYARTHQKKSEALTT